MLPKRIFEPGVGSSRLSKTPVYQGKHLERATGIEPAFSAWETGLADRLECRKCSSPLADGPR